MMEQFKNHEIDDVSEQLKSDDVADNTAQLFKMDGTMPNELHMPGKSNSQ